MELLPQLLFRGKPATLYTAAVVGVTYTEPDPGPLPL